MKAYVSRKRAHVLPGKRSFYGTKKSHEPILCFSFQLGLEENTILKVTANDWPFHQRAQMWGTQGQCTGPALIIGLPSNQQPLAVLS